MTSAQRIAKAERLARIDRLARKCVDSICRTLDAGKPANTFAYRLGRLQNMRLVTKGEEALQPHAGVTLMAKVIYYVEAAVDSYGDQIWELCERDLDDRESLGEVKAIFYDSPLAEKVAHFLQAGAK